MFECFKVELILFLKLIIFKAKIYTL